MACQIGAGISAAGHAHMAADARAIVPAIDDEVVALRLQADGTVDRDREPGIFEMTWSFSGPDGRATWERTTVLDGEGGAWPAVRWRRLGNHRIFRQP